MLDCAIHYFKLIFLTKIKILIILNIFIWFFDNIAQSKRKMMTGLERKTHWKRFKVKYATHRLHSLFSF